MLVRPDHGAVHDVQAPPGHPGPQPEEDGVDDGAVVLGGPPRRRLLGRQQRGQLRPRGVGQLVSPHHAPWVPPLCKRAQVRDRHACRAALRRLDDACAAGDPLGGYRALLDSVKWLRIGWMERWGERDHSLARFGTRFDQCGACRQQRALAETLNALSGRDDATTEERIAAAPAWVIARRDWQWAARAVTDEVVTPKQNDRDTLRVATQYELRRVTGAPFPAWLGIPGNVEDLRMRRDRFQRLLNDAEMSSPAIKHQRGGDVGFP